jgi:UDP-glucuronate 4-epimerase
MTDKILVTGSAGFIGFHTASRLLREGHHVVGLDNLNDYYDVTLKENRLAQLQAHEKFEFAKIDISDKAAMEKLWADHGGFKRVIHLAAQAGVRYSLENPYQYITSNCMGHVTVMEMCRHTEGFEHLVYASSSSVYGGNTKFPYAAGDPVELPLSLYAATKRSDELMSQTYSHLFGMPQTGLRFFTVYGPWGRPDMALFIFTKNICEGKPVPVFNHGKMRRDFTYVDDIVSGILAALKNPPNADNGAPHRVFNLGNNKSENLMDFIDLVQDELGMKAKLDFKPLQDGDVPETYADIDASVDILGFKPTTAIKEGIPKFIEWYKDYYKVA